MTEPGEQVSVTASLPKSDRFQPVPVVRGLTRQALNERGFQGIKSSDEYVAGWMQTRRDEEARVREYSGKYKDKFGEEIDVSRTIRGNIVMLLLGDVRTPLQYAIQLSEKTRSPRNEIMIRIGAEKTRRIIFEIMGKYELALGGDLVAQLRTLMDKYSAYFDEVISGKLDDIATDGNQFITELEHNPKYPKDIDIDKKYAEKVMNRINRIRIEENRPKNIAWGTPLPKRTY
jgi:hypothetical protein